MAADGGEAIEATGDGGVGNGVGTTTSGEPTGIGIEARPKVIDCTAKHK